MSDDDLICICMSVSRGEIKQTIRQGTDTINGLKATLFCCTGCGTCEGRVQAILDEEKAQESKSSSPTEAAKTG